MAISEAQQKAVNKYVKNNYDRINVTFPKGKKSIIQSHVSSTGESVNAFINRAVAETMERDSSGRSTDELRETSGTAAQEPQNVPQTGTHGADLPDYLTPDILSHIDAKRYLSNDSAYQYEIGDIIGMEHLSDLADYFKAQKAANA